MSSGGGIRTRDLRVMSPTSYQTAPPRGEEDILHGRPVLHHCAVPDQTRSGAGPGEDAV
jgi:hypothetical protein